MTSLHPAEHAQYGTVVPTALIYKYCFYLELSTEEDMEIKYLKQSWQPVANIQTFQECLSALTQF